jgi:hypothetical protein
MNPLGIEPRGGDFVAYLEQIEQRQQAQLARLAPAHGAGSAKPASQPDLDGLWRQSTSSVAALPLGALLGGVAGAALVLAGVLGEFGPVSVALGGYLIYRAARALRRARTRGG